MDLKRRIQTEES